MFYTLKYSYTDNGKSKKEIIERFEKYISVYTDRAVGISTYFENLNALYENDNYTVIQKYSPGFLDCVMRGFWISLIIDTASFFDEDEETDSFINFLNYIKSNKDKIYTKTFFESKIVNGKEMEPEEVIFPKIENVVDNIIKDLNYIIDKDNNELDTNAKMRQIKDVYLNIKYTRDKICAHKERKLTISNKINPLSNLDIKDISIIKDYIEELLSKITLPYNRTYICTNPIYPNDVKNLINKLK